LLVAVTLVLAAAAATAAQPGTAPGSRTRVESLKPQWSRPVGGATRLVGVEEYGRCSVFVDKGAVQVLTPAGDVSWTWPFAKISKYIHPGEVAVSHECDAIAFVGDASYKYAWIVDRAGRSASIKFTATPADIEFDRTGKQVAIGTYAGSLFLYSINGELAWRRDTKSAIIQDLEFSDDNSRVLFKGWGGNGVVSVAGQVEWSMLGSRMVASRDLMTFVFSDQPNHGPGLPHIAVADGHQKVLWHRWADLDAYISATGSRVLAAVDRKQEKVEADFFGDGPAAGADIQLLTRDAEVVTTFSDYRAPIALSEDGTRVWLRGEDAIDCVDERGGVLASIARVPGYRGVTVTRDFGQVLIVIEKDLTPVAVERYVVPAPCKP
jgi:hypothetical protein